MDVRTALACGLACVRAADSSADVDEDNNDDDDGNIADGAHAARGALLAGMAALRAGGGAEKKARAPRRRF